MVTLNDHWLTLTEVAERLGVSRNRVRRLLEDHVLAAKVIDGEPRVPEAFLQGNEPRSDVRGTVMLLNDVGFSDDEAVDWLLSPEDSLGVAPIEALAAGRKAEVRRVAQALG